MIRRAVPADFAGIARVHVQAWRESYPELLPWAAIEVRSIEARVSQWRSTLAETDRLTFVYVAGQDGAISGFGSAGTIRWTGLSTGSEVSALYLLDAVKRRGIGRMLFARLLRELAAADSRRPAFGCSGRTSPRGASTRRWAAAPARRASSITVNMCSTRSHTCGTTSAPSR